MGSIKPNFILDTNILIHLFAGSLKEVLPNDLFGYSIITEIELLSYPHLSDKDEHSLLQLLSNMIDIQITKEIKKQTILLRKKHNIKLPDAIICATAISNNAILLTNDKQLLAIQELKSKPINIH